MIIKAKRYCTGHSCQTRFDKYKPYLISVAVAAVVAKFSGVKNGLYVLTAALFFITYNRRNSKDALSLL
jgi:hypothetical protein